VLLAVCVTVAPACVQGSDRSTIERDGASSTDPTMRAEAVEAIATCARPTLVGTVTARRVDAFEAPEPDADVIARFPRINEQGAVQVFPILDRLDRSGDAWYRAMLPIRPNGSTGWIRGDGIELGQTDYRLVVDLERLRLRLLDGCRTLEAFEIGVGTRDTPTPRGTFFLNSLLRPPDRDSVYGAYAFGLSAYSDVITDWEGGGIVGLHGTDDASSIGREVSHGCIRLRNDAIRRLARLLPLGTPIEIS
jgi:lipoprotein-anchoring transpeptidase ErfK/SrfK